MGRDFLSSKRIQGGAKKTPTAVLRAAERVFAKQGFAGTSMRDISRASGVSQPLIHHYFRTKRDLYNEIKRQLILRFDAFWSDTSRMLANDECVPGAALRRLFRVPGGRWHAIESQPDAPHYFGRRIHVFLVGIPRQLFAPL